MSVSLALKKEGDGLQPEFVLGLKIGSHKGLADARARGARSQHEAISLFIDHEAERYTSRHLQIYLSM